MAKPLLTDDQKLAVQFDQPANLLVSAAAGSGKTTTLTERIVTRLLDGRVDADQLLVITFTELAAKDLKVKIASRLKVELDQAKTEEERRFCSNLIDQLSLAQISTIHAFCNRILSSYLAGYCDADGQAFLEPGYRILDSSEEAELLEEAIEAVLSGIYRDLDALAAPGQDKGLTRFSEAAPLALTGKDRSLAEWLKDFRTLSLAYSPDLDDRAFRQALARMLEQVRNLPDYDQLVAKELDRLLERADSFPSPGDRAANYWWNHYELALERAGRAVRELTATPFWREDLTRSRKKTEIQLVDLIQTMESVVQSLSKLSGRDPAHWDSLVELGGRIQDFSLPSLVGGRSSSDRSREKDAVINRALRDLAPLAGLISDQFKRGGKIGAALENYPPVFTLTVRELRENLADTARYSSRFMELVLLIDAEFKKRRFQRNAIQFSDIEHGALALLAIEEIQEDFKNRFKEIYVDEYQDTSSIQDALIHRIGQNNMLMVGDIKQSIYRFRYANPSLFARYEAESLLIRAGQDLPGHAPGHRGFVALLNRCFRTRPGIIHFINDFFSSFLTRESGEIEYDESQQLIPDIEKWRRREEKEAAPPVELALEIVTQARLPKADEVTDEAITDGSVLELLPQDLPRSALGLEAVAAARIIKELVGRGLDYERIAILLPTNNHCRVYEEALLECGIPVTTRSGRLFPDSLVFHQIEALLSLLDNPRQDIPLLSTLLGPFAPEAWSGIDLLTVAGTDHDPLLENAIGNSRSRPACFHDKFTLLRTQPQLPLAGKAAAFFARLDRWRLLAQELDTRDLLDLIFYETAYPDYLARASFGESNLAELERVLDIVAQPDPIRPPDLRSALGKLEKSLEKAFADDPEANILLPGAVPVLTRHASKGLEWDYVILGCLNPHQGKGADKPLISLSESEGLSGASLSDDGMTVVNNPLHQAALATEEDRERAEAWRLLYVAMTRAIHGLYLLLPVDRASLGELPAFRTVIDETKAVLESSTPKEGRAGAVLPAQFSRELDKDAKLLLAYLTTRYPKFLEQVASLPEYEPGDGSLDPADIPPVIGRLRISPWERIARQVFDQQGKTLVAGPSGPSIQPPPATPLDPSPLTLLTASLPHGEAARLPAKITVTELQRLGLDRKTELYAGPETAEPVYRMDGGLGEVQTSPGKGSILADLVKADMPLTMRGHSRPGFDGAALGTAMHIVFRFIELEQIRKLAEAEAGRAYGEQLKALVSNRTISPDQEKAALAFCQEVLVWAKSDLAGRLIQTEGSSGKVYREMPFTLALPANELSPDFPREETTLIQGMIDLWFIEEDGAAVLIDFKTDRLEDQPDDLLLRRRYGIQIDTYARAISRATGRRVKERLVWLIREGRAVSF